MKFLLLAGTLGALLLAVLVPSVSNEAYANIFTIDNYTDDGSGADLDACDLTLVDITALEITTYTEQSVLLEVAGGVRGCQMKLLLDNPMDTAVSTIVQADEMFRHMSGPGVQAWTYHQYDGVDDDTAPTGNARNLNLNLLASDDLQIDYSFADFDVNVTATIVDGDGDRASIMKKLAAGTSTLKFLKFDLVDFVLENPAVSLADIDEINVNFTNTVVAADYTVEKIHITMEMIGGEMYPVDTTALLLAGAELNAIWILPAIAAIGIGAFIVSRKRN